MATEFQERIVQGTAQIAELSKFIDDSGKEASALEAKARELRTQRMDAKLQLESLNKALGYNKVVDAIQQAAAAATAAQAKAEQHEAETKASKEKHEADAKAMSEKQAALLSELETKLAELKAAKPEEKKPE